MELMNEEDPLMLQQNADEAAVKANRAGVPNRTLSAGSTIQDLGQQPITQAQDFNKFNSMAMNLGFIKAKTLEKDPNATTMKVGDKTMPIKK